MQLRRRCYSGISVLLLTVLTLLTAPVIDGAQSQADAPGTATSAESMQLVPLHPAVNPAIADRAGYIVPAPQFLATIFHTTENRQGVASGERVVIDAGENQHLKIGDHFAIFRTSSAVHHPVSHQDIGTLVTPMGYATAVHVLPSSAVLQLAETFDAIESGYKVKKAEPPRQQVTNVALTPTEREIQGVIVATEEDRFTVAQGDIVYIDRGDREGVRIGDQFNIYSDGDIVQHPTTHHSIHLPPRVLGELSILDVQDHTAAAVITSSRRELFAGAPVALHATLRIVATLTLSDLLAQMSPCLQASHAALQAARAAGATDAELAPAQSALDSAQKRFEQAKAALAQGDTKQARQLLAIAQQDCLSAQELGQQARLVAERRAAQSERYAVQRGDTLWGISAQEAVYNNALMWPMIYKANQDQIQDPDLIFPKQIFIIPRYYSPEEAATAIQRARTRRSWRLGDGPDMYILEGVRQ